MNMLEALKSTGHALAAGGRWLERQEWWNPKAKPVISPTKSKEPSAWEKFMTPPKKRKKAATTFKKQDIHIIIKR